MTINHKYSFHDFTKRSFRDVDPSEFNDTEIVGSCFYHENNLTQVFPDGTTGVHFRRCNLDNVIIPDGCTIETDGWEFTTNKRIRVCNDLMDWIHDSNGNPVEPMAKDHFIAQGWSIDPKDIPAENVITETVTQEQYDYHFGGELNHPWFREHPVVIDSQPAGDTTMHTVMGRAWKYAGEWEEDPPVPLLNPDGGNS